MGTVEDDEFRDHLWVVNGEQPRYGPAPVVAHQAASVVPLEEKQMHIRQFCDRSWMFSWCFAVSEQSMSVLKINTVPTWLLLASSLDDIYTHQKDVFHDIQPNADQGQDIRLRDSDHITAPVPTN